MLSSVVKTGPLIEWGGGQVNMDRGQLGRTCLGAVWFLCFFSPHAPGTSSVPGLLMALKAHAVLP